MGRRNRKPVNMPPTAAGAAVDVATTQDSTTDIQQQPAGAESTPTILDDGQASKSVDAGTLPERPHVWTVPEVLAEYFPNAKRVSGGVLGGIQREVRRRNRLAEKGCY